MARKEIHIGDIGTVFQCTVMEDIVIVDISSATTKEYHYKKPSGEVLTKSVDFVTDGTDGKLTYTTILNDLDERGNWGLQVYLVLATGTWSSDIINFMVYKNIRTA